MSSILLCAWQGQCWVIKRRLALCGILQTKLKWHGGCLVGDDDDGISSSSSSFVYNFFAFLAFYFIRFFFLLRLTNNRIYSSACLFILPSIFYILVCHLYVNFIFIIHFDVVAADFFRFYFGSLACAFLLHRSVETIICIQQHKNLSWQYSSSKASAQLNCNTLPEMISYSILVIHSCAFLSKGNPPPSQALPRPMRPQRTHRRHKGTAETQTGHEVRSLNGT